MSQWGDHPTSITKRKEKESYCIKQINFYGNVGKSTLLTRLQLYKTVIIPTIIYNIETWINIDKIERNELEKIQESIIWPVEEYKNIMLLHNIVTIEGERLLKEVFTDQIE